MSELKIFKMRKIVLFILLLSNLCYSQEYNLETEFEITKITNFCKTWGFLKYYHPNVASGKFDWNDQFIKSIEILENIKSKEELNTFYINWLNELGAVKQCRSCNNELNNQYFTKNFDTTWINSNDNFSQEVSQKLKYILYNRYQGKQFYVGQDNNGNIKILNEKKSSNLFPDKYERLLSLANFWNTIEYFFPYKYMTDQKWDEVLSEMIPKFINAKNEKEYNLLMLETVVKTDDGHGIFKTNETVNYFGKYFLPAEIKIIDESAVVFSIPNDSLASLNNIKIGDIIGKINGQSIVEIINEKSKYLHGSNKISKLRNTYYFLANGQTDKVELSTVRNNEKINITVNRYPYDIIYNKIVKKEKYKIVDNTIGYVDMSALELNDVDKMMEKFQNLKGIIIDLRNYPNFIPFQLASRFIKEKKECIKIIEPDLLYPGNFVLKKIVTLSPSKEYFKGVVYVLVDENTQSRAEFSAMLFQTGNNVKTIGNQTSGADGDVSTINFSSNYKSFISGTGIFYADGTETQRKGLKIDIEVKTTIDCLQAGKDEVLTKAIELIKQN